MSEEKTEFGLVKLVPITEEMKRSYLDYAMSVIVARALPDVRDGLKPVHRRILYAMHKLGLSAGSAYKKCARIVGETIGKYHPHGDAAVYEALVRMGQDFSLRYPLIAPQGNFGSIDGDPPAAMRYTEARLTKIADELLLDLDKETVDFIDNFDGSEQEPIILPSKLPNLLLNGSDGIAVGMATTIPPHNLGEVIEALVFLLDNLTIESFPSLPSNPSIPSQTNFEIDTQVTVADLMQFVRGPDFPTGGVIYDQKEILSAYETGRGRILIRAVAEIKEKKGGHFQIVISQIPYQQNKALLVAKIANLVQEKKIDDVADLRDESDKSGLQVTVDLKSSANPQKVLNQLFKYTSLQSAYHLNMVVLVNGEPKTLNLKQVLLEYLRHRQVVVTRRTAYNLKRAQERAHILEGYKIALHNLDAVIETIKKAKNQEAAKVNLIKNFALTEIQAQAILDLQLKRLTALDRQKILEELQETQALIEKLKSILSSPQKVMAVIKNEFLEIKEKYADARRTKVVKGKPGEISFEDLIKNEETIITLSRGGYIKRLPLSTYKTQGRGGKGVTGASLKEEDAILAVSIAMTHNEILFFTSSGRVFSRRVYDLPEVGRTARGQALVNLIGIEQNEKVNSILTL